MSDDRLSHHQNVMRHPASQRPQPVSTNLCKPPTCNDAVSHRHCSEQALRGPKRHQAVSGYWHTPRTLGAFLRVRSYLVSARGHGIHPHNAIHRALAGTPWLPVTQ